MRPVLRPGLRTMRVEEHLHLVDHQCDVRLSEPAAALVAAIDGVRDADSVLAAAGPDEATTAVAWRWLLHRRLVVDADEHLQRVAAIRQPTRPRSDPTPAALPLTDLLACPDGDRRWHARRSCRVDVRGHGATAADLAELLEASGVATAAGYDEGPGTDADRPPDLVVLTHDHEPAVEEVDSLMRTDVAHLVGGLRDSAGRVGPFVVPGWSACVRCYDLRRTSAEPSWRWRRPLLGRPEAHPLGSATAPATVVRATAALLASEALAFVEGRTPHTYGCTLLLTGDDPVPARHPLDPHPWCGCVWPTQELGSSSTMEA